MPAPSRESKQRVSSPSTADNRGEFAIQDWAMFIGISLIWGSSFLLIAYALDGLTPGAVTLGRVGLGAATLWAIRLLRSGPRERIETADRPRLVMLSVVWVAVPFTLFPLAQEHINSALTGLLNGGVPIFAGIISTLVFRHAPKGAQLLGIIVGFAGIVLISLPSLNEGSSEAKGVLLVVAATLCYGVAMNFAPPLQAKYGSITLMSGVLGLATVWVLPLGLRNFGDNTWGVGPLAATVALGVVGTGAAYWIMASLVGRVGPIRASFITYLIPVVSLTLGVVFRDDTVAELALVGAALVIVGALLASRRDSSG